MSERGYESIDLFTRETLLLWCKEYGCMMLDMVEKRSTSESDRRWCFAEDIGVR